MKAVTAISVVVAVAIVVGLFALPALVQDLGRLSGFYASSIRGDLFGAMLSLAGFLFALKTFIIIEMKRNVYEHSQYAKRYTEQRRLNPSLRRYGPLNDLRKLLTWTLLVLLIASLLQFSLGFVGVWWAAYLCVTIALYAAILLAASVFFMAGNLRDLVEFWEQDDAERSTGQGM